MLSLPIDDQRRLARACDAVYLPESLGSMKLRMLGYNVLAWRSVSQTQLAVIEEPGKYRAIVIRGTEFSRSGCLNRANDLGRNMRFWWHRRKPLSMTKGDPPAIERETGRGRFYVHSGYARCADDVEKATAEITNLYGNLPWVVAGHSLGGATAILFAALYLKHARVFTIGAPKSCSPGALAELAHPPIAYAFAGDVLAKWPWATFRLTHPDSRRIIPWPGRWWAPYRHECGDYIRALNKLETS